MYSIGSTTTMAESYRNNFLQTYSGWAHYGFLALFTGPVPNSHAEIPFDSGNPLEVFRNMEGGLEFSADLLRDDNTRMRYLATPGCTHIPSRLPYLEQQYDKWSYTPRVQMMEWAYWDMVNGNYEGLKDTQSGFISGYPGYMQRSYYLNACYQGMSYYWNKNRTRDFNIRSLGFGNYGRYNYYGNSNRNIGNIWPLVLEFDEEITVDSLEYYRGWFSGNGNSAAQVTIDVWDATANGGEGDWLQHEIVPLVESGTETPIQYTELTTEVTGSRFRLSFGDTASSTLHFSWIRLMSSTPPLVVTQTSVDYTWGLVIPYHIDMHAFSYFVDTSDASTVGQNAVRVIMSTADGTVEEPNPDSQKVGSLLVDVGGPHDNTTVRLTKATGVAQGEVPELLSFITEFLD